MVRRHGQPYTLTLTGPAAGNFRAGVGGEPQTVDAVAFVRILSGRAEGPGRKVASHIWTTRHV